MEISIFVNFCVLHLSRQGRFGGESGNDGMPFLVFSYELCVLINYALTALA